MAKEYDAKVGAWTDAPGDTDAAENPDSILEDFTSDATRSELAQYIAGLITNEQASLVALVWVGRGTYSADQFDEAVKTAVQERSSPTQNYLMGIPLLADYLAEGLEKMGGSAIEAEEDRRRAHRQLVPSTAADRETPRERGTRGRFRKSASLVAQTFRHA